MFFPIFAWSLQGRLLAVTVSLDTPSGHLSSGITAHTCVPCHCYYGFILGRGWWWSLEFGVIVAILKDTTLHKVERLRCGASVALVTAYGSCGMLG